MVYLSGMNPLAPVPSSVNKKKRVLIVVALAAATVVGMLIYKYSGPHMTPEEKRQTSILKQVASDSPASTRSDSEKTAILKQVQAPKTPSPTATTPVKKYTDAEKTAILKAQTAK